MSNSDNKVIGFTCGAFDLTHAGHYLMFEECKKTCDVLLVGLQTNPNIDRPEKHIPTQTLEERRIQVEACKWVDKVYIYETEEDLITLLKSLKPNVRFIGEDWRDKHFTGDNLEIQTLFNTRDHNYSSSNLIERIINNH